MYLWLEPHHVSMPKPLISEANRMTRLGLEKHRDPAEMSRRLSPKWTLPENQKPSVFLAEPHMEKGQGIKEQWVVHRYPAGSHCMCRPPEIAFPDSPHPPHLQLRLFGLAMHQEKR